MKLSPEALAFRAKIDAEAHDWPPELKEAATFLRCELENVHKSGWAESAGPRMLGEYAGNFARLYAAWRSPPSRRS